MGLYRVHHIDEKGNALKSAGQAAEESSVYAAATKHLSAEGIERPFILLYTEKDKNPGWECFFRSEEMFSKPPHCFIEKIG